MLECNKCLCTHYRQWSYICILLVNFSSTLWLWKKLIYMWDETHCVNEYIRGKDGEIFWDKTFDLRIYFHFQKRSSYWLLWIRAQDSFFKNIFIFIQKTLNPYQKEDKIETVYLIGKKRYLYFDVFASPAQTPIFSSSSCFLSLCTAWRTAHFWQKEKKEEH